MAFLTFQADSGCESFGLSQGLNAPMSWETMKKYTAALRYLLDSQDHHVHLNKDKNEYLLFWATRETDESNKIRKLLNPSKDVDKLRNTYDAPESGKLPPDTSSHYFFLLGLCRHPAAEDRISVRLWVKVPLKIAQQNITSYFKDLEIVHDEHFKSLSLPLILLSTFPVRKKVIKNDKKDYKNPHLGKLNAAILKAVFQGTPFPKELLTTLITRLRQDFEPDKPESDDKDAWEVYWTYHRITYARTAFLKAFLLRTNTISSERKPTTMLNSDNKDIAYNLGRLFSVLECIQEEALFSDDKRKLDKTIRNKYLTTFSQTPSMVFASALRNSDIYAQKLQANGWFKILNKLDSDKQAIIDNLPDSCLPTILTLEEQALFFIGYYHERHSLLEWRKKRKETPIDESNEIDGLNSEVSDE